MDAFGAVIARCRRVSPPLGARLAWMRLHRRGDVTARVVDTLVRPGDVALDIGANWGLFAWALGARVGAQGRVLVFEPNPQHAPSLQRIAAGRPNVTICMVGLSERKGNAELHIPLRGGELSTYEARLASAVPAATGAERHQSIPVAVTTLDVALNSVEAPVDFIKCDVEGHEAALLRGARATLGRGLPTLLIEIEQRHQADDVNGTFEFLIGLGYTGYAVRRGGLGALEEFDVERDQLALLDCDLAENPSYVNDFVFARSDLDLGPLREPP